MIFWGIQIILVAFLMKWDWKMYLLEISLWANFASHWAGYSAEKPSPVVATDGTG